MDLKIFIATVISQEEYQWPLGVNFSPGDGFIKERKLATIKEG
jgi:hypothetical protein